MTARPGAALAIALVLLVVLECVVLGTMHIALQEHRIGSNRVTALTLRLEAENAVRRALGHWSLTLDTMPAGPEHRTDVHGAGSDLATAAIERLSGDLFLVRGTARELPPRMGRATAQLLVHSPLIGPAFDPAPAPIAAAGPVTVEAGASISVQSPAACSDTMAAHAVLTVAPEDLTIDPDALVDGAGGLLPVPSLLELIESLLDSGPAPGLVRPAADTLIDGSLAAVLVVPGDLVLAAGAAVSGLVLATGTIAVEAGSAVEGAIFSRGGATVAGNIRWDPCAVANAVALAGLERPRPAGPRAWLPAF